MVKKCTGQSSILAQDKVIWGNSWYDKQDGKKWPQVGIFPEANFLAQETWPMENSPK